MREGLQSIRSEGRKAKKKKKLEERVDRKGNGSLEDILGRNQSGLA